MNDIEKQECEKTCREFESMYGVKPYNSEVKHCGNGVFTQGKLVICGNKNDCSKLPDVFGGFDVIVVRNCC